VRSDGYGTRRLASEGGSGGGLGSNAVATRAAMASTQVRPASIEAIPALFQPSQAGKFAQST
jgi:hypothetical protein